MLSRSPPADQVLVPRLMADVRQTITSLHEFLLFAVSFDGSRPTDCFLEVRVNWRLLLGVEPFQRNGACTVYSLHSHTTPRKEYSWLSRDFAMLKDGTKKNHTKQ